MGYPKWEYNMHSTNLWIHSCAAETFMANPKAKALNALDSSAQRNILLSYWNQQNKMAIKYKKLSQPENYMVGLLEMF